MKEFALPDLVDIEIEGLPIETKVPLQGPLKEGYSLWRLGHGQELPDTVARALRAVHVRDFALRTLMPDVTQKLGGLEQARRFTTDPIHRRHAYVLTANEKVGGVETNAAALGWFRPLIFPEGSIDQAQYDDIDLIKQISEEGHDPERFVTAAIEVFDGHRGALRASDIIEEGVADFIAEYPDYDGVCVRVGQLRAVAMVEQSGFRRLTSEHGGGVFIRMFTQDDSSMV